MSSQRQKGSRKRFTRNAAITSIATLSALVGPGAASADDAVSLARVARQLGYHYVYLPFENAVSLSRPGVTVVVRPGDPFFAANERREPVFGMVPEYRGNDVYVSPAFMSEIRGLGHPFPPPDNGPQIVREERVDRGHVSELHLSRVPGATSISVDGHATPDSRIEIVVRAALSESLPIVVLDRATAFSDASGAFSTVVSTAPDHFWASKFIVEASGAADTSPAVAKIDAKERNPAAHTPADNSTNSPD